MKVDDAVPHPEWARATKTGRGEWTRIVAILKIQQRSDFREMDGVERRLPLSIADSVSSIHPPSV